MGHTSVAIGGPVESLGEVDYRLVRRAVLADFAAGELSEHDVCDAHPELRRASKHSAQPAGEQCPICSDGDLVYVTYAFGPRLPKSGRCLLSQVEVEKLSKRKGLLSYYVVEVCPVCSWNHLSRTFTSGGSPT